MGKYRRWDFESAKAEALKYETRSEFSVGNLGAYLWSHRNCYIDEVCEHMKPAFRWDLVSVKAEALKYETRYEFAMVNPGAYDWAKRNGQLDDVCEHMRPVVSWDLESAKAEALKYETRKAFEKGSPGAYQWAHKNGQLDVVCEHMDLVRTYWTLDMVKAEALKYETRKAFQIGNPGAYNWAWKNGQLDVVCAHMVDGSPTDNDAIYIWAVVGDPGVYKIGITSSRLGEDRIHHVAGQAGVEAKIIMLAQVGMKASLLERILLTMGHHPGRDYEGFQGSSEFRRLTPEEVYATKTLIYLFSI